MNFSRKQYSDETLLGLYKGIIKPRLIEEKMLILLRQNRISRWFSGIGQEAIAVGSAMALQDDEYILPLHRNLGVFTVRNCPLHQLFAQFQGKPTGFTKGRDRSFHFGSKAHHIVGMISHLNAQLPVADGIALADLLAGRNKVTLGYSGDGGTSEGDFHEALNVASVWNLPVIFLIENNGYGLSTPNNEQYKCEYLVSRGAGYGMKAIQIDGNNVLEVYDTISEISAQMRENPHPVLIEALTFRMRGHEEASGTKYVPQELLEKWAQLDPVTNYEQYLLEAGILSEAVIEEIRSQIKEEINVGLEKAFLDKMPQADTQQELNDMYMPFMQIAYEPITEKKTDKRYIDAISDALRESMLAYPNLILMGQDIAEYGGVFKITDGFVKQFGKERVRNTPLCESAIIGAALGMSINGYKVIVEMQFADFVSCGFNQVVNNLAKSHYRWGQNADVVIRMPTGAGTAAGPFHSQSNEAWFFHTPGLKIVYPSNPYDAKGLLNAAIEDPNPVMYFEHKSLYRSASASIPDSYYTVPIGKAILVATGEDLTIVTYGMGVHWALEAITKITNVEADIIDLRSLLPWDKETVEESVKKTGKVLVVHEDCITGGIGGEIAAWIAEHCFTCLDAPVMREGSLDTAVPFAPALEQNFLPKYRIEEKIKKLLAF